MADNEQVDEADAPEESGALEISPEAQAGLDRSLAKFGIPTGEPEDQGEGGGEDGGSAGGGDPQRQMFSRTDSRQLPPARGHRERQEERRTRAEQAAAIESLQKQLGEIMGILRPGEKPDAESDPEGFTRNLIRDAALEAIGGAEVVDFLKTQRQQYQEREEQVAAIRQENEFLNSWGGEMSTWEDEYQERYPELFEGYHERLHAFIQASDTAQIHLGVHPLVARRETMRGLVGLTNKALEANVQPVAYVDALFRQTPEFHQNGKPNGNGNSAKDRQRKENRQTAERRDAAAAAGTLATVKAPPSPTPEGKMAAAADDAPTGLGRAAALKEAAKRAGGNAKANLRSLSRVQ